MKTIDKLKNVPPGESFEDAGSFYMVLNMKGELLSQYRCYGVQYTSGAIIDLDPETEVTVLKTTHDLGATQMNISISR